jgi:hypothetical protein
MNERRIYAGFGLSRVAGGVCVALSLAAGAWAQEIGKAYAEIRLADGEAFRDAVVTRWDGLKFQIEHAEGMAGVSHARMPVEWRTKFPLDARVVHLVQEKNSLLEQQKAAEAAEKEAAREKAMKIALGRRGEFNGKVVSVTGDGLITRKEHGPLFFLECDTSGYLDDDFVSVHGSSYGRYTYTQAAGGLATIERVAPVLWRSPHPPRRR